MARVTDDAGPVKYVTLFYALSRDTAPFRVSMKASDADLYVGTIPPDLLTGVNQVLYYIEAMDGEEASAETDWHTIAIKSPSAEVRPAPKPEPPAPPPAPSRQRSSLVGVGLIAGGAAAVAGTALYLANREDGSSKDDTDNYAGEYRGSVTECLALSGQPPNCDTRSMTVVISSSGSVQSSDLRGGTVLSGQLNGNRFVLVADLSGGTNGVTGQIVYDGTVSGDRVFGPITGQYQGPDGNGVYSGSFSGTRQ